MQMKNVFFSAGFNIDKQKSKIDECHFLVEKEIGSIQNKSNVYETEAWGNHQQERFWNWCFSITTDLPAYAVLSKIHDIEQKMGRTRMQKYAPRTIDVDILFYGNEIIQQKNIVVPHPHLHLRQFVLVPLAEIAELFVHPIFNKNIRELLEICPDKLGIKKLP